MKILQLKSGHQVLLDDEDYQRVVEYGGWYVDSRGYAITDKRIKSRRTIIDMHRYIHLPAKGFVVDHIDQNKLNNQKSNLRDASKSLNALNSGAWGHNKSGYKGVSWSKQANKWRVTLNHLGKQIHLGFYADINQAAKAYKQKVAEVLA